MMLRLLTFLVTFATPNASSDAANLVQLTETTPGAERYAAEYAAEFSDMCGMDETVPYKRVENGPWARKRVDINGDTWETFYDSCLEPGYTDRFDCEDPVCKSCMGFNSATSGILREAKEKFGKPKVPTANRKESKESQSQTTNILEIVDKNEKGAGGLCNSQLFKVKCKKGKVSPDCKLWRVVSSKTLNGDTSNYERMQGFGGFWGLSDPREPPIENKQTYREQMAICDDWNPILDTILEASFSDEMCGKWVLIGGGEPVANCKNMAWANCKDARDPSQSIKCQSWDQSFGKSQLFQVIPCDAYSQENGYGSRAGFEKLFTNVKRSPWTQQEPDRDADGWRTTEPHAALKEAAP